MALYYAVDSDPSAAIDAATITWNPVPITSDSLAATLTSSISEQINASRSYANSVVTQGEISGSFGFEAEASDFVRDMLQAAMQVTGTWNKGKVYVNGSTPTCLMFLKKVARSGGTDYFVFRGVQVDSMSFSVSPGSFITGEISVMGTRMGSGVLGATDGSNDILSALPGTWTLTDATSNNLMSSVFALQNFEVQTQSGRDMGVIIQELSLTLSNQLRQQFAVGTGSPYAAGVASGRFQATLTGNAYYSGPEIINGMLADTELRILFDLVDADGDGWKFLFDKVKVTAAPPPAASGPDQDVMSSTEFQAFQSSDHGTVEVMRVSAYTAGAELLTNGAFATNMTGWTGTNWAWAAGDGGKVDHTAGAADVLSQTLGASAPAGEYLLTLTVNDNAAGGVLRANLGTARIQMTHIGDPATEATFTGIVKTTEGTTSFTVTATADFNGGISNISLKPITWV